MKITRLDIKNFRKLNDCQIEVSDKETVFVGANNSGKTSAMDALMAFLKTKKIVSEDFTISNWNSINEIAMKWITDPIPDLTKAMWRERVPTLDVWISVQETELHYVSHLLPTLDWDGGELGVRLIFEPHNIEKLYKGYKETYEKARDTESKRAKGSTLTLWPKTMQGYLTRKLETFFLVNSYLLDPSKKDKKQEIDEEVIPLSASPFKGLIKIDVINAQRGFSDPHSGEGQTNGDKRLSTQFRNYFDKHLNPEELPEESDLAALEAMGNARTEFDEKLQERFKPSVGELENLSYPGFSDPKIHITSKINPMDGLNHSTAVQFNVFKDGGHAAKDIAMTLPENYNGLGYQNLISMIFNLIRYRDEWMRVGKATKPSDESHIEPLHIMLIEEPEAHLHAQVQQVFIRKAYEVLRKHELLKGDDSPFSTQLLLSTHSSHIAHEIDFRCLRYFKRQKAKSKTEVPYATVANLSMVFGKEGDTVSGKEKHTAKFATRYLKTTHCDLFFADAAILIEGPAERMLVPHFIEGNFKNLYKSYVSLLEIGGSHAHKLKPLIELLQIPTLVITDLDSVTAESPRHRISPQKEKSYLTGNETLKTWVPQKTDLDGVLSATDTEKISDNFVRVAYQCEVNLKYKDKDVKAIPYTFEDALVLANIDYFKGLTSSKGLLKKMHEAVLKETIDDACSDMFDALGKSAKKAEMALELLWETDPKELITPPYIKEGLDWLQTLLIEKKKEFLVVPKTVEGAE